MLEHDVAFWRSVEQMGQVLKAGGYLILTARGNGFPLHEYPHDCYRFLPTSFRYLLGEVAGCTVLDVSEDPEVPGCFGIGRKGRANGAL